MAERDASGRFVAGHKKVPGSGAARKRIPESLYQLAQDAPEKLRDLVDDPDTPAAVRADTLRWAMEMVHGKPKQQADIDVTADVAYSPVPLGELLEAARQALCDLDDGG